MWLQVSGTQPSEKVPRICCLTLLRPGEHSAFGTLSSITQRKRADHSYFTTDVSMATVPNPGLPEKI